MKFYEWCWTVSTPNQLESDSSIIEITNIQECCIPWNRYNDVIMSPMASQITSLTTGYSTVYSDADQRKKHQSSASLAFVRGIHRGSVNSPHKWPVTRKMCPIDNVIMAANDCVNYPISWWRKGGWLVARPGQYEVRTKSRCVNMRLNWHWCFNVFYLLLNI